MFESLALNAVIYNIGKILGITGFFSLALLIFSGDMARFFDKFFGLDRVIKFQRKFSVLVVLFVILHPMFFIVSSGYLLPYLIPRFSILPLAAGIVALYLLVIIFIASLLYKRISNTAWQYLHVASYLLFFLALYHALNWGSDSSNPFLKTAYFVATLAVFGAIAYRSAYKIKNFDKIHATVKAVEPETAETFSLILETKKPINFKAGQFCFLRINKHKLFARHPFTISSPPQEKDLRFTIKNTGRFTSAAKNLKSGEPIDIEGPFGKFLIKDQQKDLIFIAGGVGITPFLSITKDLLEKKSRQKISLFYGVRNTKDIIQKGWLSNLNKDNLKVIFALSEEKNSDRFVRGRVNIELIKNYIKDINQTIFYICGPTGMKDDLVKSLKQLGAKRKNIVVEDFFW